ncbi:MAG TPA: GEVED domain-containing protein [Bacteroidales bacterium]|nr:GEVED domain-containing protein [Bacteroidales bacterium]
MKKKYLCVMVLFLLAKTSFSQTWIANLPQAKVNNHTLTLQDYQQAFNDYWAPYNVDKGYYFEGGVKKKAVGWKQFKRWEYEMESQVNPATGELPQKTAREVYEEFVLANPQLKKSGAANWTTLGTNSSNGGYAGVGRINCVAFHPTDNNTYWVGAASGGLWVTTNNGSSWTCLTDNNGVLAVSDIVIPSDYATSNTIYIATGDRDAWDNRSIGVLKSTDGGITWNSTEISYSLSDGAMVNRLLLDPSNNQTIIAATTNGVYKTTNGGTTWSTQLTSTDFIDMEYKPGVFSTLYGSTQDGKIYVSTNSGASWTQAFSNTSAYRIELAVSANQPAWVYAIAAQSDEGLYGIYKSTNSGTSYTQVFAGSTKNLLGWESDGSDSGGQGWYDLSIAASPGNANILLIGGVNTWRSTNGGTSWSIVNHWWGDGVQAVHADKHMLKYRSNGNLFECNDGGVYLSTDNGTSWTDKTNGLVISQMYKLSVSKTIVAEVITGLQDNGTKLLSGGAWSDVKGGDGMECLIDYTDVNVQYGTYVYGQISRTTDHWGSTTDIEPAAAGDGAWVTPFIIHPTNNQTLFAGYADVWKTTDRGNSWTKISTMNSSYKIRSMAIAPSNAQVLYVADPYTIWKTTNGGTSWSDITETLPVSTGRITYIAVKNNDPATLWVTMSGYNANSVYQSVDGGSSWTDISGGLPPIPAYTIVQNNQSTSEVQLYAGTELGVYFKKGTDDWVSFNTGLPNVKIGEIEIYYASSPQNSKLRAATYGRGLWETPVAYYASAGGCDTITNILPTDNLTYYGFGSGQWGSWTGHNAYLMTEFAEYYSGLTDATITGLEVYVVNAFSGGTGSNNKVTFNVYQGGGPTPGIVLGSKDIAISSLTPYDINYISFDFPIAYTGTDVYVGYQVYYNTPSDTFNVAQAENRADSINSGYLKYNDTWYSYPELSGYNLYTSLFVNPVICPPCAPPATQAASFNSSALTTNSMTLGWTRGNGTGGVIVVARAGSPVSTDPVSGNTYSADAAFGSGSEIGTGNYVVYIGTGTSVTITALDEGTSYYYAVYEYNAADKCYLTPALTGNATTTGYCAAGATTALSEYYISRVRLGTIDQTSGLGTAGYEDYTSQTATIQIGASPLIIVDKSFWYLMDSLLIWVDWNKDGDFLDPGENVYSSIDQVPSYSAAIIPPVGAALGTTRMRIRLLNNYYLPNNTPCGDSYYGEVEDYSINVVPACIPPTTQATSFTSSALTDHSMTVGWTRGNGNGGVIVVAREGSATDAVPVSGYAYTANAAFGSGSEIGLENYVVYTGPGTSVNVTALTEGQTYYYAVYEYDTTDICYLMPALTGNVTTTGYCAAGYPSTNYEQLIISQTYEGTSFNKYIEITNIGTAIVNLGNPQYTIKLFANKSEIGANAPTYTLNLSGTLLAGQSLIIRHPSAIDPSYAVSYSPGISDNICNFNGIGTGAPVTNTDIIALYQGTTLVDVFAWGAFQYGEQSYCRNLSVTSPNPIWNEAEWTSFLTADVDGALPNTFERLGFHGSVSWNEYISHVEMGTINQASGSGINGYQDFTSQITDFQIGTFASATIEVANMNSLDQILIWIDWNKDDDFTDAGEKVYESPINITSPHITANFTPPVNAITDTTRMRIRLHHSTDEPNPTPCGPSVYGEVEDYSINVLQACTPPASQASLFASSAVTENSMTVGWTRGSGTGGVMVVAKAGSAVDADPVSGTTYFANAAFGSGTQIDTGNYVVYIGPDTSVNVSALASGTAYYFAVYEYNSADNCYLKPALTGSATTLTVEVSNCDTLTNILQTDNIVYYYFASPDWGYFPGHNSNYLSEYAEYYSGLTNHYITGVEFGVAFAYSGGSGANHKVTFKVYQGGDTIPGIVLGSKDVEISTLTSGASNSIQFDSPIAITGTDVYIGYQIYYDTPADTFCLYTAESRADQTNSAFLTYNNEWYSFPGLFSIYSSIYISPVICEGCTTPTAPIADTSYLYCQNDIATQLTATGSNHLWYTVPVNGTGSPTAPTPTTTATGTTHYYVSQTINGCESPRTDIVVTVNEKPGIPSVGPISHPTCILATGSVFLYDLPASGNWTLTMTPGNITTNGTGTGTTISGLAPGTYTFTATNTSGCTSASSANVVINAQPAAPAAPSIGPITQPTCLLPTGSVFLYDLPASGTWTLTMTPGGVTTNGTGTGTTISGLAQGTYTFTVTNASGCTSASSDSVVINTDLIPTAEAGPKTTFYGTPVQIGDAGNGPGTISWLPPAGLSNPTIGNPTASPAATTTYTITVNNNGCVRTDTATVVYGVSGHIITGKTRYLKKAIAGNPAPNQPAYNAVLYNIDNVEVILKTSPGGAVVSTTMSDANGNYQFTNVPDGDYILAYDHIPYPDTMQYVNHVNAVDLALLKYNIGHNPVSDPSRYFSDKHRKGANVDNNASINTVDIARISGKIGMPNDPARNYPKGNWVAFDTLITVAGTDLNVTLQTLAYGDYDASSVKYYGASTNWAMAKELPEENIILQSDESLITNKHEYFEVPLRISTKMNELAAVGLELCYPHEKFKLISASMSNTGKDSGPVKINPALEEIIAANNDLLVTDDNGIIRVVFATTDYFDIAANEELVRLGFSPLNNEGRGELDFNLRGTGLIANQYGEINEAAYLTMPKIFVQGEEPEAGYEFSGYPNPFSNNATLTYTIPENGKVKLTVFNAIGELITELVNETQAGGNHTVAFSQKNLFYGMYTFKLEFEGMDKSKCMVIRMVH